MASNENNDPLTTVPIMKDLIDIVIPRVAAKWITVAHYMDLEVSEIKIIKEKHKDDPEKCCMELFERWLERNHECDKSWKVLLDILEQIRHLTAATEQIKKELSQLQLTHPLNLPLSTTVPSTPPEDKPVTPPEVKPKAANVKQDDQLQNTLQGTGEDVTDLHSKDKQEDGSDQSGSTAIKIKEEPLYTADDLQNKYESKKAKQTIFQYDDLNIQQKDIVAKVQAMLVVVNDYEFMATMYYLTPPDDQNTVLVIHCTVIVGPDEDSRIFYVGKFGKCPVAVTRVHQGYGKDAVYHAIRDRFKALVLIVAVGVASGFSKNHVKLGDVLISERIHDCAIYKHENDTYIPRGNTVAASKLMLHILKEHFDWKYPCTKDKKRNASVITGLILSKPVVLNDKSERDRLLHYFGKEAKGLEMEGFGIMESSLDVIFIKGVCDLAGDKNKAWLPTAALAANDYLFHHFQQRDLSLLLENKQDEKGKKLPKEHLQYTVDDLQNKVAGFINKFNNDTLSLDDKDIINGVYLLLMVVNDSEFLAAMYYFSKNEGKGLHYNNYTYYVGKWGKIPAALVLQGVQGIAGPGGAQNLTRVSIELFTNLKLIVSVGVCGTMDRLGNVIVSSRIDGCNLYKVKGDQMIDRALKCRPGKNILNFLKIGANTWSFLCTKPGIVEYRAKAVLKPMLSGSQLIASGEYRDKLIANISKEAGGVEMEGIGVVDGIDIANKKDQIEFIIVKAGCDYADESKSKEWQPVAAMAAADFVYSQLQMKIVQDWLLAQKSAQSPPNVQESKEQYEEKDPVEATDNGTGGVHGKKSNMFWRKCWYWIIAVIIGLISVILGYFYFYTS